MSDDRTVMMLKNIVKELHELNKKLDYVLNKNKKEEDEDDGK